MNKKYAILLFSIMLMLCLACGLVACGPKADREAWLANKPAQEEKKENKDAWHDPVVEEKPLQKDEEEEPEEPEESEEPDEPEKPDEPIAPKYASKAETSDVLGRTWTKIKEMFGKIGAEEGKKHLQATVFLEGEGIKLDVHGALVADAVNAKNNRANATISWNDKEYLTLYFEDDILYFGEELAQDEKNWVKFDQVKQDGFASEFAKQFPAGIAAWGQDVLADNEEVFKNLDIIVPLIASTGLVNMEAPYMYFWLISPIAEGTYRFDMDMNKFVTFIKAMKRYGVDVQKEMEELGESSAAFINQMVEFLFGGTLSDICEGKITEYPTISVYFDYNKSGNLTGLYMHVKKAESEQKGTSAMEFTLGVKDVAVSSSTSANILPNGLVKSEVEDAAITVDVRLQAANLQLSDGESLDATISGYMVPDMQLGFDESGKFYIDVNNLTAKLFGINGDKIICKGDYDSATNYYRLDFKDLFDYVGIAEAITQYEGYFDLEKQVKSGNGNSPNNQSGNIVDDTHSAVKEMKAEGFDFEKAIIITSNVIDLINEAVAQDAYVQDVNNHLVTIRIGNLISYFGNPNLTVMQSKELASIDMNYYLDVDNLLRELALKAGVSEADVRKYVALVLGVSDGEIAEKIAACDLTVARVYNTGKGFGARVILSCEEEVLLDVSASVGLVARSQVSIPTEGEIDAQEFEGTDIYESGMARHLKNSLWGIIKKVFASE